VGVGKEPVRPCAGGDHGLVSDEPASIHSRSARPFDRDDAGPLRLLWHNRQLSTPKLVRPSGRDDLAEVAGPAGLQEAVLCTPTASPSARNLHIRDCEGRRAKIGGIEETSASFEARSAPRSYPTTSGRLQTARTCRIGFHKKTVIGPVQSSFIPAKGRNHELHMARHQGSEARAA
jgi:hypothetical protein